MEYLIEGPITPAFIADSLQKHQRKTMIQAHAIYMLQVEAGSDLSNRFGIRFSGDAASLNDSIAELREALFKLWPLSCMHIHHSIGPVAVGEIYLFLFLSASDPTIPTQAMTALVERMASELAKIRREDLLETMVR